MEFLKVIKVVGEKFRNLQFILICCRFLCFKKYLSKNISSQHICIEHILSQDVFSMLLGFLPFFL